jgi:hypothetical protein
MPYVVQELAECKEARETARQVRRLDASYVHCAHEHKPQGLTTNIAKCGAAK